MPFFQGKKKTLLDRTMRLGWLYIEWYSIFIDTWDRPHSVPTFSERRPLPKGSGRWTACSRPVICLPHLGYKNVPPPSESSALVSLFAPSTTPPTSQKPHSS